MNIGRMLATLGVDATALDAVEKRIKALGSAKVPMVKVQADPKGLENVEKRLGLVSTQLDGFVAKSAESWNRFRAQNYAAARALTQDHGAAMKLLGTSWKQLQTNVGSFVPLLAQTRAEFMKLNLGAANAFFGARKGMRELSQMWSVIQNNLGALQAATAKVPITFGQAFSGVTAALSGAAKSIAAFTTTTKAKLQALTWQDLATGFTVASKSVLSGAKTMWANLGTIWTTGWTKLQTQGWPAIVAGWNRAGSQITRAATTTWNAVTNIWSAAGRNLSNWSLGAINAVTAGMGRWGAAMTTWGINTSKTMEEAGRAIEKNGKYLMKVLSLPIAAGIGVSVKAAAGYERITLAMESLAGSAAEAQKMLEELREFSVKSPFKFPELVSATRRMMAFGFSAKEALPILRNITDAAAGLGLGSEGIDRITLALGQMRAKNKVMSQEMNQLAEAGIGGWRILAEGLGTTIEETMKFTEERLISAAEALPVLLKGMQERYGGQVAKQMEGIAGQWEAFKNRVYLAMVDVGLALKPFVLDTLEILTPFVKKIGELSKAFGTLPKSIQTSIVYFTGFLATIGPLIWLLGGITIAFGKLGTVVKWIGGLFSAISTLFPVASFAELKIAVGLLAQQMGGLGRILLLFTGPKGWLTLLGLSLVGLIATNDQACKALASSWERLKGAASSVWTQIKRLISMEDFKPGEHPYLEKFLKSWTWMWDAAKRVVVGFVEVVIGTLTGLAEFMAGLANTVIASFNALISRTPESVENLKSALKQMYKGLENIAVDAVGAVTGTDYSLPSLDKANERLEEVNKNLTKFAATKEGVKGTVDELEKLKMGEAVDATVPNIEGKWKERVYIPLQKLIEENKKIAAVSEALAAGEVADWQIIERLQEVKKLTKELEAINSDENFKEKSYNAARAIEIGLRIGHLKREMDVLKDANNILEERDKIQRQIAESGAFTYKKPGPDISLTGLGVTLPGNIVNMGRPEGDISVKGHLALVPGAKEATDEARKRLRELNTYLEFEQALTKQITRNTLDQLRMREEMVNTMTPLNEQERRNMELAKVDLSFLIRAEEIRVRYAQARYDLEKKISELPEKSAFRENAIAQLGRLQAAMAEEMADLADLRLSHVYQVHREQYLRMVESIKQGAGDIFDAMVSRGKGAFTKLFDWLEGMFLTVGKKLFQNLMATLFSRNPNQSFLGSVFQDVFPQYAIASDALGEFKGAATGGLIEIRDKELLVKKDKSQELFEGLKSVVDKSKVPAAATGGLIIVHDQEVILNKNQSQYLFQGLKKVVDRSKEKLETPVREINVPAAQSGGLVRVHDNEAILNRQQTQFLFSQSNQGTPFRAPTVSFTRELSADFESLHRSISGVPHQFDIFGNIIGGLSSSAKGRIEAFLSLFEERPREGQSVQESSLLPQVVSRLVQKVSAQKMVGRSGFLTQAGEFLAFKNPSTTHQEFLQAASTEWKMPSLKSLKDWKDFEKAFITAMEKEGLHRIRTSGLQLQVETHTEPTEAAMTALRQFFTASEKPLYYDVSTGQRMAVPSSSVGTKNFEDFVQSVQRIFNPKITDNPLDDWLDDVFQRAISGKTFIKSGAPLAFAPEFFRVKEREPQTVSGEPFKIHVDVLEKAIQNSVDALGELPRRQTPLDSARDFTSPRPQYAAGGGWFRREHIEGLKGLGSALLKDYQDTANAIGEIAGHPAFIPFAIAGDLYATGGRKTFTKDIPRLFTAGRQLIAGGARRLFSETPKIFNRLRVEESGFVDLSKPKNPWIEGKPGADSVPGTGIPEFLYHRTFAANVVNILKSKIRNFGQGVGLGEDPNVQTVLNRGVALRVRTEGLHPTQDIKAPGLGTRGEWYTAESVPAEAIDRILVNKNVVRPERLNEIIEVAASKKIPVEIQTAANFLPGKATQSTLPAPDLDIWGRAIAAFKTYKTGKASNSVLEQLPELRLIPKRDWKIFEEAQAKFEAGIEDYLRGFRVKPFAREGELAYDLVTEAPTPQFLFRGVPRGWAPTRGTDQFAHATPWFSVAKQAGYGKSSSLHPGFDIYATPITDLAKQKFYRGGALSEIPLAPTRITNSEGMNWDSLLQQTKELWKRDKRNLSLGVQEEYTHEGLPELSIRTGEILKDLRMGSFEADFFGKPGVWSRFRIPSELNKPQQSPLEGVTDFLNYAIDTLKTGRVKPEEFGMMEVLQGLEWHPELGQALRMFRQSVKHGIVPEVTELMPASFYPFHNVKQLISRLPFKQEVVAREGMENIREKVTSGLPVPADELSRLIADVRMMSRINSEGTTNPAEIRILLTRLQERGSRRVKPEHLEALDSWMAGSGNSKIAQGALGAGSFALFKPGTQTDKEYQKSIKETTSNLDQFNSSLSDSASGVEELSPEIMQAIQSVIMGGGGKFGLFGPIGVKKQQDITQLGDKKANLALFVPHGNEATAKQLAMEYAQKPRFGAWINPTESRGMGPIEDLNQVWADSVSLTGTGKKIQTVLQTGLFDDRQGLLIGLHNTYGKALELEKDRSEKMALGEPQYGGYILTNQPDMYESLAKSTQFNVLLQTQPKEGDFSTSRYANVMNKPYVNVEALHGDYLKQKMMLEAVLAVAKPYQSRVEALEPSIEDPKDIIRGPQQWARNFENTLPRPPTVGPQTYPKPTISNKDQLDYARQRIAQDIEGIIDVIKESWADLTSLLPPIDAALKAKGTVPTGLAVPGPAQEVVSWEAVLKGLPRVPPLRDLPANPPVQQRLIFGQPFEDPPNLQASAPPRPQTPEVQVVPVPLISEGTQKKYEEYENVTATLMADWYDSVSNVFIGLGKLTTDLWKKFRGLEAIAPEIDLGELIWNAKRGSGPFVGLETSESLKPFQSKETPQPFEISKFLYPPVVPAYDKPAQERLEKVFEIADEYSKEAGLPLNILRALIMQESGGNPLAEVKEPNGTISRGLLQLNSQGRGYGVSAEDQFDIKKNIELSMPEITYAFKKAIKEGLSGRDLVMRVAELAQRPADVHLPRYADWWERLEKGWKVPGTQYTNRAGVDIEKFGDILSDVSPTLTGFDNLLDPEELKNFQAHVQALAAEFQASSKSWQEFDYITLDTKNRLKEFAYQTGESTENFERHVRELGLGLKKTVRDLELSFGPPGPGPIAKYNLGTQEPNYPAPPPPDSRLGSVTTVPLFGTRGTEEPIGGWQGLTPRTLMGLGGTALMSRGSNLGQMMGQFAMGTAMQNWSKIVPWLTGAKSAKGLSASHVEGIGWIPPQYTNLSLMGLDESSPFYAKTAELLGGSISPTLNIGLKGAGFLSAIAGPAMMGAGFGSMFGKGPVGKGIGAAIGGLGAVGVMGGMSALGTGALTGGYLGTGVGGFMGGFGHVLGGMMTHPITAVVAAGLVSALLGYKFIKGKSSWEAGSMEAARDLGGVGINKTDMQGFYQGVGLTEKTAWKIRKDIMVSPKFLTEIAGPAAKAQGRMESFLRSLENVKTSWGTFNFRKAYELGDLTGDWSELNQQFVDAFSNSKELTKVLPQFADALAAVGEAGKTALEQALEPWLGFIDALKSTLPTMDSMFDRFLKGGEITQELRDRVIELNGDVAAFEDLSIKMKLATEFDRLTQSLLETGKVTDRLREIFSEFGGDIVGLEADVKALKDAMKGLEDLREIESALKGMYNAFDPIHKFLKGEWGTDVEDMLKNAGLDPVKFQSLMPVLKIKTDLDNSVNQFFNGFTYMWDAALKKWKQQAEGLKKGSALEQLLLTYGGQEGKTAVENYYKGVNTITPEMIERATKGMNRDLEIKLKATLDYVGSQAEITNERISTLTNSVTSKLDDVRDKIQDAIEDSTDKLISWLNENILPAIRDEVGTVAGTATGSLTMITGGGKYGPPDEIPPGWTTWEDWERDNPGQSRPGIQLGGWISKTGWAKVHKGEIFSGVGPGSWFQNVVASIMEQVNNLKNVSGSLTHAKQTITGRASIAARANQVPATEDRALKVEEVLQKKERKGQLALEMAGMGTTINVYGGTFNGWDDFVEQVRKAGVTIKRRNLDNPPKKG